MAKKKRGKSVAEKKRGKSVAEKKRGKSVAEKKRAKMQRKMRAKFESQPMGSGVPLNP